MIEDYEIMQVDNANASIVQLDSIERANVDSQVATAKQYPRDIKRALQNSIAMATLDEDTARSMSYALPRGGKPITGPSVHLAKLVVSNWGNVRAEAKVVQNYRMALGTTRKDNGIRMSCAYENTTQQDGDLHRHGKVLPRQEGNGKLSAHPQR